MKNRTSRIAPIPQNVARFSATVDPEVLSVAKRYANVCGFRHSFSAYVNDALIRANQARAQLLNAPLSLSPNP